MNKIGYAIMFGLVMSNILLTLSTRYKHNSFLEGYTGTPKYTNSVYHINNIYANMELYRRASSVLWEDYEKRVNTNSVKK